MKSTIGPKLTCAVANASPWMAASTAHPWLRNGSPITGATNRTYRLTGDDMRSLMTYQASITCSTSLLKLGAKTRPIRVVRAG